MSTSQSQAPVPGAPGAPGSIRLVPPSQAAAASVPAGFWRRFVAIVVDAVVITVAQLPISFTIGIVIGLVGGPQVKGAAPNPIQLAGNVLSFVISITVTCYYYGWFYKNKGATPGKLLLGLRVVDAETGEFIGYGRAVKREVWGKLLSGITLFIGYLMVVFRKDKRALHDLVANTQVIRKV